MALAACAADMADRFDSFVFECLPTRVESARVPPSDPVEDEAKRTRGGKSQGELATWTFQRSFRA